jgi:hypothetical protein
MENTKKEKKIILISKKSSHSTDIFFSTLEQIFEENFCLNFDP